MTRLRSSLLVVVALVLVACSGSPTTSADPTNTEPSTLSLHGVLMYHRYTDYSAWDSKLYMIDLQNHAMTQVGADWTTVISPMNAHFSKDGQSFTFMGSQAGLAENDWDVFVSHWDGSKWAEPVNITGPNGFRDEDPKFSPVTDTIVYKQDGVLATRNIDGSDFTLLTEGEEESSMPYFTADGKDILFERNGKIWLYSNKQETMMTTLDMLQTYYPIGVDSEKFLYTQIQESRHDSLYFGFYDGRQPERLFFDDRDFESSDAYPYEDASQYIFYVSTNPISPFSDYNLLFADIKNEIVYDMNSYVDGANTDLKELGPAWSSNAPYGA